MVKLKSAARSLLSVERLLLIGSRRFDAFSVYAKFIDGLWDNRYPAGYSGRGFSTELVIDVLETANISLQFLYPFCYS